MILQIAPNKIIKDVMTVWNEPTPDADIIMDPRNLTFKEGSVDAIYAFHVLDHIFPGEIISTLNSWYKCLKDNGKLFIIVDDFEYISRAFVGGDLSVDKINSDFTHPSNFDRFNLVEYLVKVGFKDGDMQIWYDTIQHGFIKNSYEIVVSGIKHGQ